MFATPAISADNLNRLLALRGISLLAALSMAMLAKPLFHIQPDLAVLLAICAIWGLFGAITWMRGVLPKLRRYPVRRYELFSHLAVDLVLLTAFLIFCGGTANPLTALYLMPVAAAAAVLPAALAWVAAAGAIAAYALLWVLAVPITVEDVDAAMQMHLAGMWLTFGLSALLLVGIVGRMGIALREREQRLAAAREQSSRNQRIVALGSLAAGAAHQLGTPLNTATLLAEEIMAAAETESDIAKDAQELTKQIDRCRDIVRGLLANAGAAPDLARCTVSAWLTQLVENFRNLRTECAPVIDIQAGLGERRIRPQAVLTQTIMDLLDNAADEDSAHVVLAFEAADARHVAITVRDAGNGFSSDALSHVGRMPWSDKANGLGLGLYLAHATADRLQGSLFCRNHPDTGATVTLCLPWIALGLES